jgi:hypothetical protein
VHDARIDVAAEVVRAQQVLFEGLASVAAASVAIGSWVWSTLASSAVTSMISMSTPPAAPSGFLRTNRHTTVHAESRGRRAAGAAAMSTGVTAISTLAQLA